MEPIGDLNVENVMYAVSAKQDRLEKRLDRWQADILQHLKALQSFYEARNDWPGMPPLLGKACVRSEPLSGNAFARSEKEPPSPSWPSQKLLEVPSPTSVAPTPFGRQISDDSAYRASKLEGLSSIFGSRGAARMLNDLDDRPPTSWRRLSYKEETRVKQTEVLNKLTQETEPVEQEEFGTIQPTDLFSTVRRTVVEPVRHVMIDSYDTRDSCLVNLVRHPLFVGICGSMVIANSLLVGMTTETDATDSSDSDGIWATLSTVCSIFFCLETILRIMALGMRRFFLRADDRLMNLFDTLLLLLTVIDSITIAINDGKGTDYNMQYTFKVVRLLRILRIFRIFRFFRELGLMVMMICECLTSLFWAIVLLMIILYTFAVIFTQNAAAFRRNEEHNHAVDINEVDRMFGTIARTSYYLFQSMLGGISWGQVSDTMLKVDRWSTGLFFFYILFTMLAVLNIITGIFVDNALETSRMQREFIVKREEKAKSRSIKELAKVFDQMDEDGSGTISWVEMKEAMGKPHIMKYFSALGLHCEDMRQLFDMMDDDGSDEVDLEEFLSGCTRCRGDAKSIDIQAILHDMKRLHKKFDKKAADSTDGRIVQQVTLMVTQFTVWTRSFAAELKHLKEVNQHAIQLIEASVMEQRLSPTSLLENPWFSIPQATKPLKPKGIPP